MRKAPLNPPQAPDMNPFTGSGPFVYRSGRQVFNLKRGVRFPYGLPCRTRSSLMVKGLERARRCAPACLRPTRRLLRASRDLPGLGAVGRAGLPGVRVPRMERRRHVRRRSPPPLSSPSPAIRRGPDPVKETNEIALTVDEFGERLGASACSETPPGHDPMAPVRHRRTGMQPHGRLRATPRSALAEERPLRCRKRPASPPFRVVRGG